MTWMGSILERSRWDVRRSTFGAGIVLAVVVAAHAPAPAAAHSQAGRRDRAGAKHSPVELKRVAVNQHVRKLALTFSGVRSLPKLSQLTLYPDAAHSSERHMCVAVSGHAVRHNSVLCVGGKPRGNKVRVGISRLHKSGRLKKIEGVKAKLDRPQPSVIKLELGLSQAGFRTGHFRFFGVSGWHGPACATTPPAKARRRSAEAGCTDRWPVKGSQRGRIRNVVRTGCSIGNAGAYRSGPSKRKQVALTFDDGPSDYTLSIMHELDRRGAKGTFFEVGSEISGRESIMRKLIAHGHDIGDHSLHHENYPGVASMRTTQKLIKRATGFKPCAFRPPYGNYNSGTVSAARSLGMSVALWDRDTNDWKLPGTGSIEATAISAKSGSIVLMHDGGGPRSETVAAVPKIVKKLQERGYKLVTLTHLLGGHYKLREAG